MDRAEKIYGDEVYAEKPRRTWLWILLLVLFAFIGGCIAAIYIVSHDIRAAHFLRLETTDEAAAQAALAKPVVIRPAPAAPPPAAAGDPAIAGRIDALEDKIDGIESQAREATGDASRAEGLLVAFAARRALDRGVELGYIEALLRQRFGGTQPQAVAMVLSAARQPVTLGDLQAGLDTAAPALSMSSAVVRESWWQSARQELANLIVVRRADQPSSQPADRVARAQRMLEAGQVDAALAEVLRLPDHGAATTWIAAARRYLAGRGALDQIETSALLDPSAPPLPEAPDGWPSTPATLPAAAPKLMSQTPMPTPIASPPVMKQAPTPHP